MVGSRKPPPHSVPYVVRRDRAVAWPPSRPTGRCCRRNGRTVWSAAANSPPASPDSRAWLNSSLFRARPISAADGLRAQPRHLRRDLLFDRGQRRARRQGYSHGKQRSILNSNCSVSTPSDSLSVSAGCRCLGPVSSVSMKQANSSAASSRCAHRRRGASKVRPALADAVLEVYHAGCVQPRRRSLRGLPPRCRAPSSRKYFAIHCFACAGRNPQPSPASSGPACSVRGRTRARRRALPPGGPRKRRRHYAGTDGPAGGVFVHQRVQRPYATFSDLCRFS